MSSLLDILEDEAVYNQRRVIAAARSTCDYCGKPFRYGYSSCGNSGGWGHLHVMVKHDGPYYVVCDELCRMRLVAYLRTQLGRVPRLIGRQTVEEVMR